MNVATHFTLQRLVGRKEDHLTAIWALAVELDPIFRERAASLLLEALPRIGSEVCRIVGVEVQRAFALGTPDIVLRLADGRLVAIENKLEAAETETLVPDGEDEARKNKTRQLAKYLKIKELSAVAFIRASYKAPSAAVLGNPRYLRPADGREHFLWRDFLPLMQDSEHPVTRWLHGALRVNGFVPPDPTVGDLDDPARQENFRLLWESTAQLGRELGWRVTTGTRKELYFSEHPSSISSLIWANPTTGELKLRVHPKSPQGLTEVQARVEAVCARIPEPQRPVVELTRVGKAVDRRMAIDLRAPLESVIGQGSSVEMISARLRDFVGRLLREL
jgi:hypothetical protein